MIQLCGCVSFLVMVGNSYQNENTFLQKNLNLEEPVRMASPHRINLKEPVRVASPHRINLEEPGQGGQPT